MRIVGANLRETEGEFKNLTDYVPSDINLYKLLEYIQNLYYDACEEAKNISVKEFPVDGHKVVLKPMMLNHRCHAELDILKSISEHGILATEWFGIAESESEGAFCTFVDRIKPDSYRNAKLENLWRIADSNQEVVLFFDGDNDVMKKLIHFDVFEFKRVKNEEPDKLDELYTFDEQVILNFISTISPGGSRFHSNPDLRYYYWSAIPGGIPSILVNGICVKLDSYTDEYIEELSKLFPNATIFDMSLNVLHQAHFDNGEERHLR